MNRTQHFLASLATIGLALSLLSCNDNPSSSGGLKGTLALEVIVVDQDGNFLSDGSGVTVGIDGTDRTATTVTNGTCSFADLPAGTYVLTLTKPGHSTIKIYGYQFVGGGTAFLRDNYVVQLPTYDITSITARIDTNSSIGRDFFFLSGNVSVPTPDNAVRRLRVFMDTSAALTAQQGHYLAASSVAVPGGDAAFNGTLSLSELRRAGVRTGTTVYVVAYPMAGRTVGYYDPTKQEWHETNLSPLRSALTTFVMP